MVDELSNGGGSELEDYRICLDCIGDEFLKEEIRSDGVKAQCWYCKSTGITVSIGDLAYRFESVFEEHFQRTPDTPNAWEYAVAHDPEIDFPWNRAGEPVAYVIREEAEIEDEPAEHIRQVLEGRNYDRHAEKAGEENPFDSEACYERKEPNGCQIPESWANFERTLQLENRSFNREAESILTSIFEGLADHRTPAGKPIIVNAGPGHRISHIYRARTFQSSDKLKAALERPDQEIGPPPAPAAMSGRMNARGISLFYGATQAKVALSEVRPPVGSRVVLGRFELLRPLRLLDVQALQSIYVFGSVFDSSYVTRRARANFLRHLSDRISRPVFPDAEPLDYIVTQSIADFLASLKKPDIHGLLYPSVQYGDHGKNVVLFHKASRV